MAKNVYRMQRWSGCDAMDTDTDTDPIRIGYGSEKYLDIRERVILVVN